MNRIALLVAATATAVSLVGVAPAGAKSPPRVEEAAADCTAGTSCTITWTSSGSPIRVYEGTDPDAIDTSTPVATVDAGQTVTVGGLDPTKRYYFALKAGDAKGPGTVVADRSLHLASAPNARDIGGYETKDGHHVKWGRVFRSDAISKAEAGDLAKLDALGIKLICDFRAPSEVAADGVDVPVAGAENVSLPIFDPDNDLSAKIRAAITGRDAAAQEALLGNGKAEQVLVDAGTFLAGDPVAKKNYQALLERLTDAKSLPALTHCTAGKDRTGWSSAVILSALGVPKKIVVEDYLLTNEFTKEKNASTLKSVESLMADPSLLLPVLEVRPEYIAASFATVKKQYGTFDNYLRKGLGISKAEFAKLKQNLLTP
jgi:protein-tyrosine phosphatase